ncbi:MAG: single-stranded-DNA-specific exonuclease RecJ [Bacteroidetes bacterium]|nr:single-stranded-DNA-specific exonuclease RecJ [Bacteroidota bacterium]
MQKRWIHQPPDPEAVARLRAQLNLQPALLELLVKRGIQDLDTARSFFRPDPDRLHAPWLMKDMKKAVDRIEHALQNKESILIYGDYDVDGTTSVASMYCFLRKHHAPLDFYIPHRYREGYGLSQAGIDYAIQQKVQLIITLDCGIKSVDLIKQAKDQGIDVIICDHHLPDPILPPAYAILNAKQPDCTYPFKELCGCGVGYKLMTALCEQINWPQSEADEYLDLLATAIAADIVSMSDENRVLTYMGLEKANKNPNLGIQALAKISGLTKTLHIQNLVFMIAPRVNAAGRMDDAKKAVRLFTAESEEAAMEFAKALHADNDERKQTDRSITQEALRQIEANPHWKERVTTVVFHPDWHKGVVGIVASRLIEHHYKPTIVLTRSGEEASGSARSVPGFNLYEAIYACRELLTRYGGHMAAAGMSLPLEKVDDFREQFEQAVQRTLDPALLTPSIRVDAEIRLADIHQKLMDILNQMEPFGPDNEPPVFLIRNVTDTGNSKVVKEDHLRFVIKQDKHRITGIGFCLAKKSSLLLKGTPIDLVCHIEENEYQGNTTLQIRVLDIRSAESAR